MKKPGGSVVVNEIMSGLNSILETLAELSLDELTELQFAIQEEFENRDQRKNREILKQWASEGTKESPRAVKHMSFRSKQGWVVIVAVFCEGQQEMFREVHQNRDQAHELAAKVAVENSKLVDSVEPMVIW